VSAPAAGATRVVFFGSGGFALPILDALLAVFDIAVVAVVSAPDRPAGRGQAATSTPVAAAARSRDLTLLEPARLRDESVVMELSAFGASAGVLADYGRIVPPSVLELPKRGFLNVHPSLLPRHRGASPIPAAILAGDPETGVSIIEMGEGIDDGPIVDQARVVLRGDERAPDLERELAAIGAQRLSAILGPWLAGEIAAQPQDSGAATLTRPLRREDGRIDPALVAQMLERHVRAFQPWPGTFADTSLGRLIVDAASVGAAEAGDVAGTIVADGDGLALATRDGRLRLESVRLAGTRGMSGEELRRGRPGIVGVRLGDER
jgi:methionyl-tRNA formyltransferase